MIPGIPIIVIFVFYSMHENVVSLRFLTHPCSEPLQARAMDAACSVRVGDNFRGPPHLDDESRKLEGQHAPGTFSIMVFRPKADLLGSFRH